MSASGGYGPTRVAAGIVGTADLRLGSVAGEVLETRPSRSKPDRGTLRIHYRYLNQHDEVVLSLTTVQIVKRRASRE